MGAPTANFGVGKYREKYGSHGQSTEAEYGNKGYR